MLLDLDSLASAIALAWYRSVIENKPTVSLTQTSRADLHLRAENLFAMKVAGLDPHTPPILCIDDIPPISPFPSNMFALVDHNRLLPRYTRNNPDAKVVAIVDHHEDEGCHKDTADPRVVRSPVGSASSLIAQLLASQSADKVPSSLASFLLCAILVDTNGLKPGGKAEKDDLIATSFLLSRFHLTTQPFDDSKIHEIPELQKLTASLLDKKGDVSHLNTHNLLRRDYKEYTLIPHSSRESPILVGLATIPIGLMPWIKQDDFWTSTEQFLNDRGLTVLGILTSFRDEPQKKHERGKHRREQLFLVRDGVVEGLADELFKGLKHAEALDLKKRHLHDDYDTKKRKIPKGFEVKVWEQGNVQATRKVTAPLVKAIIEGSG
jgi:exopolyphosphatase